MKSWRSIEYRLAAWYSLLLLAGLASLGTALWFGVNYSMVAAVDDLLAARVDHLVAFVQSEFGGDVAPWGADRDEGEFKGTLRRIDSGTASIVVGETQVRLAPGTIYQSDFGAFSADRLKAGQFLEVVVERIDSEWSAVAVILERGARQVLQEELYEYTRAVPDGRLIHIRTPEGETLVSPEEGVQSEEASIPWEPGASRRVTTVTAGNDAYRVLNDSVQLAGRAYEIQAASSLAAVEATRQRLLSLLLWILPLGLLLSLAGGYFIGRGALRPIEKIADVAARVDVTRLSERLDVPPTGDVVQQLAETFNGMLERLESSVKRLDKFTADASHELRSPVTVIRTTAELALRQDRSEKELRADMKEIVDEAAQLTELIDDLLTLARGDSVDASTIPMGPVDLSAITREVVEKHERLAGGRAIALDLPATEAGVWGQKASLNRLLSILLDNAVHHTPEGSPIRVSLLAEGADVVLSVSDTGKGIPRDELGHIFERFYRLDSSRKRASGGYGLGLSIAKCIADSHGGTITATSEPNQGSCFIVRLPGLANPRSNGGQSGIRK